MKFIAPLLCLASLFFVACGKETPPPAPVQAPAPPQPKKVTTGKVELIGLPEGVEKTVEVICVSSIPNKVYELITQQQTSLDAYLNPKQQESTAAAAEAIQISEKDHEKITAAIANLQKDYPERVSSELFDTNGETKTYVSRQSLYDRYQPMVQALKVENFINGINAISTQMRKDYELLQEHAKAPDENGKQAKADINFLAAISQYLQRYQSIVTQFDEARRKEALRMAQEQHAIAQMASPEVSFKRFQQANSHAIELELYKTADGTAYSTEGGAFEVPGHGKLIIRALMDGHSVFFVNEGPGAEFIEVTELRSRIIDPAVEPTNEPIDQAE